MSDSHPPPPKAVSTSLSVKLGNWFEARATGWGVAAMPFLLFLAALLVAAHLISF